MTDEESRILVAAEGHPDLAFLGLGKRPAICVDEKETNGVSWQPEQTRL